MFNNLSENLGTLRGVPIKYIKLESHINYILCSSHRSLLGAFFWTYILMVLILFIIFPILFIIQNYIFIILSLLSAILIKALALNFYNKHFKYFYDYMFAPTGLASPSDKWKKLVYLVTQIVNNIYKIIKHLLKI